MRGNPLDIEILGLTMRDIKLVEEKETKKEMNDTVTRRKIRK